ncbi:MAG: hypothetical protein QOH41_2077 [Blastocatellia bacterium]|jgi:hypothetical protein|nr:hypothetical protein [Blastocatellia bacterium]
MLRFQIPTCVYLSLGRGGLYYLRRDIFQIIFRGSYLTWVKAVVREG